jgi:hypothetical protein
MIEVHGLTKRYGDVLAVDDLSFDVASRGVRSARPLPVSLATPPIVYPMCAVPSIGSLRHPRSPWGFGPLTSTSGEVAGHGLAAGVLCRQEVAGSSPAVST